MSESNLRCAACKSEGPFSIVVEVFATYSHADDVSVNMDSDIDWGSGAYCRCHECDHASNVAQFEK